MNWLLTEKVAPPSIVELFAPITRTALTLLSVFLTRTQAPALAAGRVTVNPPAEAFARTNFMLATCAPLVSVVTVKPVPPPPAEGVCQFAAVVLVAVRTWPVVGVPLTATPLTLATVGEGSVPVRSPPAVALIVAAVPSPRFVRAVVVLPRS